MCKQGRPKIQCSNSMHDTRKLELHLSFWLTHRPHPPACSLLLNLCLQSTCSLLLWTLAFQEASKRPSQFTPTHTVNFQDARQWPIPDSHSLLQEGCQKQDPDPSKYWIQWQSGNSTIFSAVFHLSTDADLEFL